MDAAKLDAAAVRAVVVVETESGLASAIGGLRGQLERRAHRHDSRGHRRVPTTNKRGVRIHKIARGRTGVADVIPARDDTVWGALYDIEDDELTAIDRKEGYGWAYTRVVRPVLLEAGDQGQAAVVYTVRIKEPAQVLPSRQYLDQLIAAAHERRLPDVYVEKLETMAAC